MLKINRQIADAIIECSLQVIKECGDKDVT